MHFFYMGLILGLSLIIALGPQNLFIIRQTINNDRPFLVSSICFTCDVILIIGSVLGVGQLILAAPVLKRILLVLGVGFLLSYGFFSIIRAMKSGTVVSADSNVSSTLTIITITLSFSLLNPQAIIDTVVMIAGSANQLAPADQVPFMEGAILASLIWFFSLVFVTKLFAPLMRKPNTYRLLEMLSGFLMIYCAYRLL